MSILEVKGLSKRFEHPERGMVEVFDDLSLSIQANSFTSIMGPSGCGKSTLLNILAGLVRPDEGEILLEGKPVAPGGFSYAYVFQEPRLLNWKTVEGNLRFALESSEIPQSQHDAIIDESLDMVGLLGEKETFPLRLSGGMRQRVGIARALSVDPKILLMDEPFNELDEITARELRKDVVELWQETGKTIIFVTHDISEGVYLSDEIIFLNKGGNIFNRAEISISRPREFGDPELINIERQLMEEFIENVKGVG